jgi:hypothetical protein
MSGERELMEKVAFGIEVEAFLRGPIGSYLLDRLQAESAAALEQLKTVEPQALAKIVELQLTIRRGENIEGWLGGIIQEGWYAERQLKGEEL